MKKNFDKLIQNIQDGITETFQSSVFGSDSEYNSLIEACKEFLIYKGYKIIEPINYTYNIKKPDDVIYLFYALSDSKHPELMNNFRNMAKDRKIASLFVKARMEASSINKKEALKECAEIIITIFEYEGEFNFNTPLVFGMLGQKKLGWITDKAVQIINKKKQNKNEERRKKLIIAYERIYDVEQEPFGDLYQILQNL